MKAQILSLKFLDFSEMEFEVRGPSAGSVFVMGFKKKLKRNHLLNLVLEMLDNVITEIVERNGHYNFMDLFKIVKNI